ELRRQLAHLEQRKLSPKALKKRRKDLVVAIADTEKRVAKASTHLSTLDIQAEEVLRGSNTPGESVYELLAKPDVPVLTALRIEVPPADGEKARHSPEPGFIVNRIDGWLVKADGRQEKIAFRYFVPDSETNLQSALDRAA